MQKDFIIVTFGKLIPKDKISENDSENMSVLRNNVHSTSKCVHILMDSDARALIIHDLFVRKNKFSTRNFR